MRAIRVTPNNAPKIIDIEDKLEVLQDEVGGYIQVISPFEDRVAIVCDDDGKMKKYELNRVLRDRENNPYDVLCGTFLIVGVNGDSFTSLSDDLCNKYMKKFETPDKFLPTTIGLFLVEGENLLSIGSIY